MLVPFNVHSIFYKLLLIVILTFYSYIMNKVTGIMSSGEKRSSQAEYIPLDRGDNELIRVNNPSPKKEESAKRSVSSESTLNIVTLFDSKPSTSEDSRCLSSHKSGDQDIIPCCICQAAWGHWNTEILKTGKNQSCGLTAGDMERSCTHNDNSESACRICLEGRGAEGFISPCDCSGTMGMVHRSCLERWLSLLNSSECEICQHKFKVHRHTRPPREFQLPSLPLDVCGDLICITILSPLCVMVIYFTVEASRRNIGEGRIPGAIALIFVATSIVVSYFIWVYFTFKQALSFWWGSNRIIRLNTSQVAPAPTRNNFRRSGQRTC